MSKRTISTIGAVAAVAAVALAGCGGSNSSSSSSAPSLSAFKTGFESQKATFTKIGTDLQSAIATAPKSSNTAIESEFSSLATRTTQAAAALRTLKPPARYSATVSALASGFDAVAADMSAVADAAKSGNAPAAKAAAKKLVIDTTTVHSNDLSLTRRLGLPTTS
jgi:hypothetical protein